jgi:hypothetical protein
MVSRGTIPPKENPNESFTIENETNNIMVHSTAKEAESLENAVSFRNEAGLAKLAADWPMARLIEIWNSLPGVTPVKKFTSRDTAIRRIWAQIQNLGDPAPAAAIPEPTPATSEVAPGEITVVPDATPTANDIAPKKARARKEPTAEETPKAAKESAQPRAGSRTDIVLGLLRREGGVTAEELMSTTGWQAHSVRGSLSGTVRKKLGLELVSGKAEDGKRVYSLPAQTAQA